jgi:hypothetical protein
MNAITYIVPLAFTIVVYTAIGYVVWKFYQIMTRMADDLAAIRKTLQRGSPEPSPGMEFPDDPLA